MDLILDG
jgi:hypothetical protein